MKQFLVALCFLLSGVFFPVKATATTAESQLTCVDVGWVVENQSKFGIRNQCNQRIYLNVYVEEALVNQEFLDKGQWFPVPYAARVELFSDEASLSAGKSARTVTMDQQRYCEALPEGKVEDVCANYVVPTPEVSVPEPTPEVTPLPEVTPSEVSAEAIAVESTSGQTYLIAMAIFGGVIIAGGGGSFAYTQRKKRKSIYIRSGRRRKYRTK